MTSPPPARTLRLPGLPGYDAAFAALARAGLAPADLVHVVEYGEVARPAGLDDVPIATVAIAEGTPQVEFTAYPGGGEVVRAAGEVLRIAEDTVHLPTIRPEPGADFRAEYRDCLERAAVLLKAAGLGLDALVRTVDYTRTETRADYPRCGRPRKELLGGTGTDGAPVFPGAAGLLVDALPSRVALDATASRAPLRTVNPGWARYGTLTYKPGVLAGDTLFLAGFAALEPATQRALFPGELLTQATFTYASIAAVLREVPGAWVTRLVEYTVPGAGLDGLAELRKAAFGEDVAVTEVRCDALLRPEFLIEVVPTAVVA